MENTNQILAQKQAWRRAEERRADRRQKDGTAAERKDLADAIRYGRQQDAQAAYSNNFWQKLLRRILPVMVLGIMFCGSAQAFTASWYGATGDTCDPWKHTTMANGHKFDENALTAASWRYPLGSWIRVTNVATGRSVVVKITDRGPGRHLYRRGRIVDLTRGAFARIASLNQGVIRIKVKRI